MKHIRHSKTVLLLGMLCTSACTATPPAAEAPGSGGSPGGGGGAPGGGGTPGGSPIANGTCAKNQLKILFTPMFSAFDGKHIFQVPVVVNNIDPSAITFGASDPSMVDIGPVDPTTGIAVLTVRKAGKVDILASAGGLCGTSPLTITETTAENWEAGNARYNNGIVLQPGRPGGGGDGGAIDGPSRREIACTNCHGDTATMGPFRTVSHTPEQTGGLSDAELEGIFRRGMVPAGKESYFDFAELNLTVQQWSGIHRWEMSDEEAKGIITYLRSLTPAPQKGTRGSFGGGFMRPDGGGRGPRGDGGFQRGDGGAQTP
jgi:hypothetical protein